MKVLSRHVAGMTSLGLRLERDVAACVVGHCGPGRVEEARVGAKRFQAGPGLENSVLK